jgi:hypothetical protein
MTLAYIDRTVTVNSNMLGVYREVAAMLDARITRLGAAFTDAYLIQKGGRHHETYLELQYKVRDTTVAIQVRFGEYEKSKLPRVYWRLVDEHAGIVLHSDERKNVAIKTLDTILDSQGPREAPETDPELLSGSCSIL